MEISTGSSGSEVGQRRLDLRNVINVRIVLDCLWGESCRLWELQLITSGRDESFTLYLGLSEHVPGGVGVGLGPQPSFLPLLRF